MDVLKSLLYPDEVVGLMKYYMGWNPIASQEDLKKLSETAWRCYDYLNKTSRTFAAVIQALDGDLRHAVCVFYLVLRALDTVEDDMTIPVEEKVALLRSFYTKLEDPDWTYDKSQEKDKIVLEDFTTISHEYRDLAQQYREVISETCKKMGEGMCEFLQRDVLTMDDWNLYGHYGGGIVGIGLVRLFAISGYEDQAIGEDTVLSNSIGVFLQKINTTRDFFEDSLEGREFWPKQIWSRYVDKLSDFKVPVNTHAALSCLNGLITDALQHVPDFLKFISRIKNKSVFNFCAIPQLLAMATLAACYNNPNVFSGSVKIRKGQAVSIILNAGKMDNIKGILYHYAKQIQESIPSTDPSADRTRRITSRIMSLSSDGTALRMGQMLPSPLYFSVGITLVLIMTVYVFGQTLIFD